MKAQSDSLGFTSGGKQPDDGGQSILDRFNPYQLFAGTGDDLRKWEKDNDTIAHVADDGELGTTPLAIFAGKNPENPHVDDWVVYALAPYRPAKDGVPFIAFPIGHGTTNHLVMILRTQGVVHTLQASMFSTAVLDVYHNADGDPVAAVIIGNAFGNVEDDGGSESDEAKPAVQKPYKTHTLYYPVGITEAGVKLLVPPGTEDALSYEDAKRLAEEFFQKTTQV